jgi:membrane-associated PAP2 superfamily phosphatase
MRSSGKAPPLLFSHALWPLLVFIAVALLLEAGSVDLRLADWIYLKSGASWSLRDAWLTRDLIHEGGRTLVGLMTLMLLVLFAATCLWPPLHQYRRGLTYLVVSTLAAALVINVLKQLTHIDCPWDLLRYGGSYPYAGIFELVGARTQHGACFPAGHASAGYAWFGLYYLAREYRPHWRLPVLGAVLALGLVFGIGQQLRGAHFVSHDWWTLGLCWFMATACYLLFFRAARLA